MTLIRTSANRIASFVVRYASAGSKEWAQAIASELNCIENDWHALGWALGGIRVLFSIQPSPLSSLDDLEAAARKHVSLRLRAINNSRVSPISPFSALVLVCFAQLLPLVQHQQVTNHALKLAGFLLLLPMTYLRSREPVPNLDDRANLVRFYVAEMATLSRNSVSFVMLINGQLCLLCGYMMDFPHSPVIIAIIALVWLAGLTLVITSHVNHRRRYAQIKALLSNPSTM